MGFIVFGLAKLSAWKEKTQNYRLLKPVMFFFFDRKELKTKWEGIGLNLSPAMLYKEAPTPFNARVEILCVCHEVSPPTTPSHLIHLLLVCANGIRCKLVPTDDTTE